jgi:hypothetical protein
MNKLRYEVNVKLMIPDYGELVSKNYTYQAVGSVVLQPA